MNTMQKELAAQGREIAFTAVNSIDATGYQRALIDRADFPLFQDSDSVKAWEKHQARKDDILIYDATGKLHDYLPYGGARSIDLAKPEGYANVRNSALAAAAK